MATAAARVRLYSSSKMQERVDICIPVDAITARFLRYVAIDTQSEPGSDAYPSSEKQLALSRLLEQELTQLGIASVEMDVYGYLIAHIPGRGALSDAPCVGFLAHVDTSPDAPGANVRPTIVRDYDGGEILLSSELGVTLNPAQFPEMLSYQGQNLIVTDGTTLLGADDKAGIAAIMEAVAYLLAHPEVPHAPLAVAFTLDEEIGRGVSFFDTQRFPAQFAYTVDGGAIGELEYENFNAAEALITIHGCSVHPGYAAGRMRNALHVANQFHSALPLNERPETTSGREGFYHLTHLEGHVGRAQMEYIIRDFEAAGLEQRKERMMGIAHELNLEHGEACVEVTICDQYRNMRDCIAPHMHVVETARRAMLEAGIEPIEVPIRGGTDGANLSWRGLPCPNLFAGGHNFHGPYEFLPIESLAKAAEVIVRIAMLYAR